MPPKTNVILIGASGHAKVIIDIIEKNETYNIVGLVDSFKPIGQNLIGYKILGKKEDLPELRKTYKFNHAIIAVGDNWTRNIVSQKVIDIVPTIEFITAIHPNSTIGKNVIIGKGTAILAGVIVDSDSEIGEFCILNTKSSLGHDGIMKNYSSLAPNATLGGNVTIGNCSAISLGANIIQDITIGNHTIIGAGSLVIRNVPDYSLSYGIPSKIIKQIKKGEKYLYHRETIDNMVKT